MSRVPRLLILMAVKVWCFWVFTEWIIDEHYALNVIAKTDTAQI